jgi:hypothetical protein
MPPTERNGPSRGVQRTPHAEKSKAGPDQRQRLILPSSHHRYVVRLGATIVRLYRVAVRSGDAKNGPRAAFDLGLLLHLNGDAAAAPEAYQRAIDSGHPDAASSAALNLGEMPDELGEPDASGRKNCRDCA